MGWLFLYLLILITSNPYKGFTFIATALIQHLETLKNTLEI
ncbi:MAG: hypothetical protein ACI9TY_000045 [Alphaproteobacteria bacterium]|jgi:hypothetical protein